MRFKYKVINAEGKREAGEISANDKSAALLLLKKRGLTPLDIKPISEVSIETNGKKSGKSLGDIEILEKDIHEVKIKKKRILSLLSQFAIMLKAGVSLALCLQVMISQEKDRRLKKILKEIEQDMYSGHTLSSSMGKFKAFNDITISIISAGEANGRLDSAFDRAAKIMGNEVEISSKVKSALGYPIFLLCLTTVVVIVLNIIVLPIFAGMFSQMGAELPLITRIVMSISGFLTRFWYLLLILVLLLVAFSIYGRRNSKKFRIWTDMKVLQIPLVGDVLHKMYVATFSRVMASLVGAGVEIISSLTVASGVIPNTYMRNFFDQVLEDVKVGVPINLSMGKYPVFDSLFISMVRVGEESGMLNDVLDKLGELYEAQTEAKTKLLTSMIEPIITVLIALVVGTVVVSVVLPMFGQYSLLM